MGVKFLSNAWTPLGSPCFANFRLPDLACLRQVYQSTLTVQSLKISPKPLEYRYCLKTSLITIDQTEPQHSWDAVRFVQLFVFDTVLWSLHPFSSILWVPQDPQTHLGNMRVEFHSSVNGLHCVHLCRAQPPPRRSLRRESAR